MPMSRSLLLAGALLAAILAAASSPASARGLSGAYLAAMQADLRNDYAVAADYYERALQQDGGNPAILQNAVIAHVALGDVERALQRSADLEEAAPGNPVANVVMLADAFAREDFDAADSLLDSGGEAVNPLLRGLLAGWVEAGRGDFEAAQAAFDAMDQNDALKAYGQYHKALSLALVGDFVSAEKIMAGEDDQPLHLSRAAIAAHAQVLAQIEREEDAMALLDEALSSGFPDALLDDLRERLASGEEVVFDQVTAARDGAADAYITLADALDSEDSIRVALIHTRLAAHIRPDLVEARLLAGEILEQQGRFDLATEALSSIPEISPWFVTAEIRRAETQREAGDPEAGIATLEALVAAEPDQIEAHSALGDALRSTERFAEAAEAYGEAIALIDTPTSVHWVLYYTRGISYERSDQWDAAEADFRKALELEPDQPLVLNYLGYSLVEQRRDLDEALAMIEEAVRGQRDDGYITDSLGWVLYRLGRYDEAVPHMLRAVELVPDDPVINDHLGDVLWMVGRAREARFQWRRALSFGPADDLDMDRIRRKLEVGLDAVLLEEAETGEAVDEAASDG